MAKMPNGFNKAFQDLEKYFREESLKVFSEKVVSLAYEPINVGDIDNPNGHGRLTGSCGDTMEIFVRVEKKIIGDIKFLTDGCGATLACGSAVTELAKGKTPDEARKVGVLDILNYLDDLPPSHAHCALLAVNTLQKALEGIK